MHSQEFIHSFIQEILLEQQSCPMLFRVLGVSSEVCPLTFPAVTQWAAMYHSAVIAKVYVNEAMRKGILTKLF